MVNSAPEVIGLTFDPHENLVQMPLPLRQDSHPRRPLAPDLGGEYRAETVPPVPDRFVADIDSALVQQILDVSQRKWKPDIQHDRQADDLGGRLEIAERAAFGDLEMMRRGPSRLKPVSSDRAVRRL